MIKLENTVTPSGAQWRAIIMGARNPMNSWDRSDSHRCGSGDCDICIDYEDCPYNHDPSKLIIGPNDHELMMKLRNAGTDHRKFMRMITVYVDITAPLYWWKEFDTYKVGTVANSCSTMHKIHAKEFTLEDFSTDKLIRACFSKHKPLEILQDTIDELNYWREAYIKTKNNDLDAPVWMIDGREASAHDIWYQMIQLLPTSYNQKRTVMLNYEVLANIYKSRKAHKLDEWREFCKWIEELPYSELIVGEVESDA